MTSRPILSILTPAVPSRLPQLAKLCEEIEGQIGSLPVEHLVLLDNKRRTVGEKRDALLRMARGKYVAFVDDDDWIAEPAYERAILDGQGRKVAMVAYPGPGYVEALLAAAEQDPDVITFRQEAIINEVSGEIVFGLGNRNEPWVAGGTARRNAWHVCAWRRALAVLSKFPATSYGEDWAYAERLCSIPGLRAVHVDKVLHRYIHSAETTEAPPPL